MRVEAATREDLPELAQLAATTFPLACPPAVSADNVAAFIAANLSAENFARHLDDPQRAVLLARDDARILGYAMLIRGVPDDAGVAASVPLRPAVELSKMYALPDVHGAGVSAALMTEVLQRAAALGAACVWLGVNQENQRAQRFYAKAGFTVSGTKTFRLGEHIENDYVMVRTV
ncbi:N-acetyltransferase GCN5 [Mycolicibacterium canariasense]|uniref:N-acetyltransferase GCN5 n=1 Tax=Mycolicibacterium canariasense TaxID=228230 RepID=A0A124E219_MYCCR|nr:GNAT family N-acetyltransferase [Mycolicibacterium canariasense]MCV7209045.1 GNAT family N-acetyltransferase [Mycolicibacterium canariasense]ORV06083.1 acetyltransferase [Mycolicibacterium canariasense]GAS95434.1 N-acetyltransferase GCN5 [Mycolicibacterium canariasense]